MQNAILGMRTLNVTQGNFTNFTHKAINAVDLAGEDTGQDVWRAKNRWKCVNTLSLSATGFANTCLFSPCDENGNLCKVMTPSGVRELTIALTHDDVIRVKKGGIYDGNAFIYKEGTAGNATGNHIHAEACFAFVNSKVKLTGNQYYKGSTWVLPNAVPLHEALFLLEGYNYEPISTGGYGWRWVKDIESDYQAPVVDKDLSKGAYGVDLSKYDKDTINWEELAKVAKFAILKCGFGADKPNQHEETFLEYSRQCDKYGIAKGAYIYSYAETEAEAINEAKHIIRLCDEAGGNFPLGLFMDMEDSLQKKLDPTTNTNNVMAYINQIWTTNYKAGFYSYLGFCNSNVHMSQINGNAIVWLANYGNNDGYPHAVTTNFDYDIYQYTSTNADKGFSSRKDLDQNLHLAFDQYVTSMPKPEPQPEVKPEEPKPETPQPEVTGGVSKYSINYKGYTVHVGKLPKKGNKIMGSVDGNKYGTSYDKTVAAGFSDKKLLNEGYKEAFATNGSTFYTYDGATYAEGLEISRGEINQEYELSTVSKFANCMAVGFTRDGGVYFDLQKNIQNIGNLYGAVTFIFGIMKDGKLNTAGSENNRGGGYTAVSGRSILAEDPDNYYSIAFEGVTGKTGLTGSQLFDLCKTVSPTMLNAGCFDGGGSVWQRINNDYTITTTRLVKNGVMLFYKPEVVTPEPEQPEKPQPQPEPEKPQPQPEPEHKPDPEPEQKPEPEMPQPDNRDELIQELNNKVTSLNNQVESLNNQIGTLNNQIESLNSQVGSQNNQIESLNATIATLTQEKENLEVQLTDKNRQLECKNAEIDSLNIVINNQQQTIDNLTQQLMDANAHLSQLETVYRILKDKFTLVNEKVQELTDILHN